MATAYAVPGTRPELDALKANLSEGFGKIVGQVQARTPEIQAAYNEVAAQIRDDAAARYGRDQETARQQQAGMAAAAQSLGVQPVSLGENSRSARLSRVLSAQYNGDAQGWGGPTGYLATMRDAAAGRNQAAADAFNEDGRHMRDTMERQFQEYLAGLASYGGGGGGGGRGGRGRKNYADEPLLEFPKVQPMSDGVKQGLVGSAIRNTAYGIAAQSAGKLSSSGSRWLGPQNSQGVNSTGIDPNVLKRALAQSRAKR